MDWIRRSRFERERLDALRSIESEDDWLAKRSKLRAYFRNNGAAVPETDEALLTAAHLERLRVQELSIEERSRSRSWLRDRGYDV